MAKIIERIWDGEIGYASDFGVQDGHLMWKEKDMLRFREVFEKSILKEQKEMYDEYIEKQQTVEYEKLREAFCEGFSIGLKIASEAFVRAEMLNRPED